MCARLPAVRTLGKRYCKLDLDEARRLYESGLSFSQVEADSGSRLPTWPDASRPPVSRHDPAGALSRPRRPRWTPPRSLTGTRKVSRLYLWFGSAKWAHTTVPEQVVRP